MNNKTINKNNILLVLVVAPVNLIWFTFYMTL